MNCYRVMDIQNVPKCESIGCWSVVNIRTSYTHVVLLLFAMLGRQRVRSKNHSTLLPPLMTQMMKYIAHTTVICI